MDKTPLPSSINNKVKSQSIQNQLNTGFTGTTHTRNFENWQLLKRYQPFLSDIRKLRIKYKKPNLDYRSDWVLSDINKPEKPYSIWENSQSKEFSDDLRDIAEKYNSQKQITLIRFYFLYSKDYITPGSPYNHKINSVKRSDTAFWTKIEVTGVIDKREISFLQNTLGAMLYGAILEAPVNEPKDKSKVCYTFDKKSKKLIFNLYISEDDYNKHLYEQHCELIGNISKKYFKTYKIANELYKNLLLLDRYEEEYTLTRLRLKEFSHEVDYQAGPNDVIMEIYTEVGDEIDNTDLLRIRNNIRQVRKRVKKIQVERFVTKLAK